MTTWPKHLLLIVFLIGYSTDACFALNHNKTTNVARTSTKTGSRILTIALLVFAFTACSQSTEKAPFAMLFKRRNQHRNANELEGIHAHVEPDIQTIHTDENQNAAYENGILQALSAINGKVRDLINAVANFFAGNDGDNGGNQANDNNNLEQDGQANNNNRNNGSGNNEQGNQANDNNNQNGGPGGQGAHGGGQHGPGNQNGGQLHDDQQGQGNHVQGDQVGQGAHDRDQGNQNGNHVQGNHVQGGQIHDDQQGQGNHVQGDQVGQGAHDRDQGNQNGNHVQGGQVQGDQVGQGAHDRDQGNQNGNHVQGGQVQGDQVGQGAHGGGQHGPGNQNGGHNHAAWDDETIEDDLVEKYKVPVTNYITTKLGNNIIDLDKSTAPAGTQAPRLYNTTSEGGINGEGTQYIRQYINFRFDDGNPNFYTVKMKMNMRSNKNYPEISEIVYFKKQNGYIPL